MTEKHAPLDANDTAASASVVIWIDAREALITRWIGGEARLHRIESEVPDHHRSTGHVRHDPGVRHGGGGPPQTAGEPHRLEHLARFVEEVADHVDDAPALVLLGPGTVRERLEARLRERDAHAHRTRTITCLAERRLTEPQLVARLRRATGIPERRQTVGAYRWSRPAWQRPSGEPERVPRRVAPKPPHDQGPE